MVSNHVGKVKRVLIISSHPLFRLGIRTLLKARPEADVDVVGMVDNIVEAAAAQNRLQPDLMIVDYDDEHINREAVLARFVQEDQSLRVVMLSLKEGGSQAVVYDRRRIKAANINDWLHVSLPSQSKPDLEW